MLSFTVFSVIMNIPMVRNAITKKKPYVDRCRAWQASIKNEYPRSIEFSRSQRYEPYWYNV